MLFSCTSGKECIGIEVAELCRVFSSIFVFLLKTMELEYGRPVEEIFIDITPEPLAAASLGQVSQSRVIQ